MKTSIAAIAVALVYLVSLVTADQPSTNQGVDVDSSDSNQDTDKTYGLRGHDTIKPVGVISTKVNAADNNVLVKNSNLLLSLSDRVELAKIINEIPSDDKENLSDLLARYKSNPLTVLNPFAGLPPIPAYTTPVVAATPAPA